MAKRRVRRLQFGNFEDYAIKKVDAEQRLASTFALFVKSEQGGLFITGGADAVVRFGNQNFHSVLIATSLKESEEAVGVLREASARVRNLFSENDFYAMIAADFLSGYLGEVLENMKIPVALAAEFMAIDLPSNKLIRVLFSGDFKIDDLNETDENYFFVGLYSKKTEDVIKKELEKRKLRKVLSKPYSEKSLEELKVIAVALKKKLRSESMNLVF